MEVERLDKSGYRLLYAAILASVATLLARLCSVRYERFLTLWWGSGARWVPAFSSAGLLLLVIGCGLGASATAALADAADAIGGYLSHAGVHTPRISASVVGYSAATFTLNFLVAPFVIARGVVAKRAYVAAFCTDRRHRRAPLSPSGRVGEGVASEGAAGEGSVHRAGGPGSVVASSAARKNERSITKGLASALTRRHGAPGAKASAQFPTAARGVRGDAVERARRIGISAMLGVGSLVAFVMAMGLLACAAAVYGALHASQAGCEWALPLLDSEGVGLIFELALSNATSLAEVITSIGVPADIGAMAAGVAGVVPLVGMADSGGAGGIGSLADVALGLSVAEGLELTNHVVPAIEGTLSALAPICSAVSVLEALNVRTTCALLAVAIDVIVGFLNQPPLNAGLAVNGSEILKPWCQPIGVVVRKGSEVCAQMGGVQAAATYAANLTGAKGQKAEQQGAGSSGSSSAADDGATEELPQVYHELLQARLSLAARAQAMLSALDAPFQALRRIVVLAMEATATAIVSSLSDSEGVEVTWQEMAQGPALLKREAEALCDVVGSLDRLAFQLVWGGLLVAIGAYLVRSALVKYNDLIYLSAIKASDDDTRLGLLSYNSSYSGRWEEGEGAEEGDETEGGEEAQRRGLERSGSDGGGAIATEETDVDSGFELAQQLPRDERAEFV